MDRLASTKFRKTYATLERPTTVTVHGHVIGEWVPARSSRYQTIQEIKATIAEVQADAKLVMGMIVYPDGTTEGTAFDDRDSQTTPGFNTRPFTPVPKKGKAEGGTR